MIDNRDLRIGNYVNYNDGSGHDDIRQVVGIDRNSVTSIVKGCHFATAIRSNELIYPIPLSEEVLLKCGFKLNKEKTLFEHDKCGLRLMDIVGLYYRGNFPIKADVTSIHQLQNLYYALTGEELEVSL